MSFPFKQKFRGAYNPDSEEQSFFAKAYCSLFAEAGMLGGDDQYLINQSLRFRASNSASLSRTFSSGGSRTTWTLSMWIKRGLLGTNRGALLGVRTANNDTDYLDIGFWDTDTLRITGGSTLFRETSMVFRDPTAWCHIVVAVDTNQATANNRIRLYVNGAEVTAFGTTNNPALGANMAVNQTSEHRLGVRFNSVGGLTEYFDGYQAEINFINGSQLTPASFGQIDPATNSWVPRRYTGTYGTNGFYLPFNDAASTTTISQDRSGNGNNWTSSGVSVTSGVTFDQMLDTPTNNYAVLNRLAEYGNGGVMGASNGNLQSNPGGASSNKGWLASIPVTPGMAIYAEATFTATLADNNGGVALTPQGNNNPGDTATSVRWGDAASLRSNSSSSGYGTALSTNDVVMIAVRYVDDATCRVWFGRNGTWFASGNPATDANPSVTLNPAGLPMFLASYHFTNSATIVFNFGQRAFAYTPPTGFVALNTKNLPTPPIKRGDDAMQATLRTGTGATASVTSLRFQPDLVWIKRRDSAGTHVLTDAVRGANSQLFSNQTVAEETQSNALTAFNSNGYSLGNNNSGTYTQNNVNFNTATYVDLAWKRGATYGFDIVPYTGNGANRTIAHALGAVPHLMIGKRRDGSASWTVYHRNMSGTPAAGFLLLNTTDGYSALSSIWNSTAPTSSVFSLGTDTNLNTSGALGVMYLWTSVPGFSLFGSYIGNGSTDGRSVWCGFKPRFILIKRVDSTGQWILHDTARDTFNVVDDLLNITSNAESTFAALDITANGFKLRNTDAGYNASGGTYIFAAFAETPFKFANAR